MYGSPGAVYGGYPGVGPPMQGFPPSSQEAHLGVPPAYAPRRSGQAEGAAHGQYGTEMQQGAVFCFYSLLLLIVSFSLFSHRKWRSKTFGSTT